MRSALGKWVTGEDFFDREAELRILEEKVEHGNHVLLVGQRRIGKTSIVRELGRRLQEKDWIFLFADMEGETCPEDAIAALAQAAAAVRPIVLRIVARMKRFFPAGIVEVNVRQFRMKFSEGVSKRSWRTEGDKLLREIAVERRRVLLVIDELPIFLKRMADDDGGPRRVDEFLSWLRGMVQTLGDECPALIVSGSIGLQPLVHRLGLPDRINYLHSFRVKPWDRKASVECFYRLAESYGLIVDDDVPETVYDSLGIGIPQHVQLLFARLRECAIAENRSRVTTDDVHSVYRSELLGSTDNADLAHYETRLRDTLDDAEYDLAKEILAETATVGVFTPAARRCLDRLYAERVYDVFVRIREVLDVLVHDGYLHEDDDGYRFQSHLLGDWWAARFRGHHVALERRLPDETTGRQAP